MTARTELEAALREEASAYRLLLAGKPAHRELVAARDAYLRSHSHVRAASWGRLLGALKMAILADDGLEPVALQAVAETGEAETPAAAYLCALACVALGRSPDVTVLGSSGGVAADVGAALAALDAADRVQYRAAVTAVLGDFEGREDFLTGVRFADTVAVLERLAEPRGMSVHPRSDILPPPQGL